MYFTRPVQQFFRIPQISKRLTDLSISNFHIFFFRRINQKETVIGIHQHIYTRREHKSGSRCALHLGSYQAACYLSSIISCDTLRTAHTHQSAHYIFFFTLSRASLHFGDGFLPSFSWEFFGVSWAAFSLVNAGRDWFLLSRNRSNDLILFFASFGLARSFFRRHFLTLGNWDLFQA
jgi:hypothetical protein